MLFENIQTRQTRALIPILPFAHIHSDADGVKRNLVTISAEKEKKVFSLARSQLDFSEDLTAHSDTTRKSSVTPLSLLQLDANCPTPA